MIEDKYVQEFNALHGKLDGQLAEQHERKARLDALQRITPTTELSLDNNRIKDLVVITKIPTQKLQRLSLRQNNIVDISPLTQLDLSFLKNLLLSSNQISDIRSFSHPTFHGLQFIQLMHNQISDIGQIKDFDMPNLCSLNLAANKIYNLKPLADVDFSRMPKVKIVVAQNPFPQQQRQIACVLNYKPIMRVILDWL